MIIKNQVNPYKFQLLTNNMEPLVLAVTGASAQPLAERAIQLLLKKEYNIHLILSRGAYEVWNSEIGIKVPVDSNSQEKFWRNRLNVHQGKLNCHKFNDHSAQIASGSFHTKGMIIVPCTMGTLGRIASGFSLDLIERCADVHLKEGRPLILSPRETPFSLIHLRNMSLICEAGATICPPIPAWYTNPKTLDEMVDFLVIRLFDALGENLAPLNRWKGGTK